MCTPFGTYWYLGSSKDNICTSKSREKCIRNAHAQKNRLKRLKSSPTKYKKFRERETVRSINYRMHHRSEEQEAKDRERECQNKDAENEAAEERWWLHLKKENPLWHNRAAGKMAGVSKPEEKTNRWTAATTTCLNNKQHHLLNQQLLRPMQLRGKHYHARGQWRRSVQINLLKFSMVWFGSPLRGKEQHSEGKGSLALSVGKG